MNYGIQLSASGALTAMYRQDVAANNLANMDTAGFKPDIAATRQRPVVREEDSVWNLPSNALLERLGGGLLLAPNRVDFGQGALQRTGNSLDVAIQGDGFMVVRDDTDTSGDRLRLTRDGRLTRDRNGRLVSAATGQPVLDPQNRPIRIPDGPQVVIEENGLIRQGKETIGQIALIDVPDRAKLTKLGNSLFNAPADAINARTPSTGALKQFHIEQSGVDEFRALMAVSSAAREVETNIGMIQSQDRMIERAISSLGRVA
jgi:flagellar basal body rod protein FlgG